MEHLRDKSPKQYHTRGRTVVLRNSTTEIWSLLITAMLMFSTKAQPWVWYCFYATVLQKRNEYRVSSILDTIWRNGLFIFAHINLYIPVKDACSYKKMLSYFKLKVIILKKYYLLFADDATNITVVTISN